MVMNYIRNRIENSTITNEPDSPHWVAKKNSSLKAWQHVEFLKKQKMLYIKSHTKPTHFRKKQSHHITGSEIADALNLNRSTLMHTSSYSVAFGKYLNSVNTELEIAMRQQLEVAAKKRARGPIDVNKQELLKNTVDLKKKLADLSRLNAETLVRAAFDLLPLPIKKKLGIE